MQKDIKTLPPIVLSYMDIASVVRMQAKLYKHLPFLPFLPNMDEKENIFDYTFGNIPVIKHNRKTLRIKSDNSSFERALAEFGEIFNNPTEEVLEKYFVPTVFTEKYFALIKKFTPKYTCFSLFGIFSSVQLLKDVANKYAEPLLEDSIWQFFIHIIYVKALSLSKKIREMSPETKPILILDDPELYQLGTLKRNNENITSQLITDYFKQLITKLHEENITVAVKCLNKCDWQIPIDAGADIICFDAYNNPNNLTVIPEKIDTFINNGGMIDWAIIPTLNEAMVKSLDISYLEKRLFATFNNLIDKEVSARKIYKSALVSIQGDISGMPIIFAEKVIILNQQLADRIHKHS